MIDDNTILYPLREGERVENKLTAAYNDFMTRLFGSVPDDPRSMSVDRDRYAEEMHAVQEAHGLEQGDPDFLEWVLTLVGRSPVLNSEGGKYDEQHRDCNSP